MTATIAAELSSFWPSSWSFPPRRVIVVQKDPTPQGGTLVKSADVLHWKRSVIRRAVNLLASSPSFDPRPFERMVELLNRLPPAMPPPFVALGDDGSLGLEWDVRGYELHVNFSDDAEEVYFRAPDGQDWEGTLSTNAKRLMSAVRQVVAAS